MSETIRELEKQLADARRDVWFYTLTVRNLELAIAIERLKERCHGDSTR